MFYILYKLYQTCFQKVEQKVFRVLQSGYHHFLVQCLLEVHSYTVTIAIRIETQLFSECSSIYHSCGCRILTTIQDFARHFLNKTLQKICFDILKAAQ
ncbi:hypothetical protein XELAEV_18035602mg [Xenopus laevis]|uniref:Uncharacterized protein n=1 Tax=Xenopus laevis TaxID=8355 RepID=A0A974CH33_XENLA|nr:hypothetical protein XELAEV_18035602mg [Xenopus laevis]